MNEIDRFNRNIAIYKWLKLNGNPLYQYINVSGEKEDRIDLDYPHILPEEPKIQRIKGIVLGVTDTGKIITIPEFKECKHYGIFGLTGFGKTMISHSIIEYLYYDLDYRGFIANDYKPETFIWSAPSASKLLKRKLSYFHREPSPLPVVMVIPETKEKYVPYFKTPKVNTSLDYNFVMDNLSYFVDLGGSEKYFQALDLSHCKTLEDAEEEFKKKQKQGIIPDSKTINKDVKPKIMLVLRMLFKEKIVSFDKKVVKKIRISNDDSVDTPIPQLIRTNVIPVLVTTILKDTPYFGDYFKVIIDDLLKHQQSDQRFKKNLFIFIDEISQLYSQSKNPRVMESLRAIATQGRIRNISMIYAGQNISRVDNDIISNTHYGIHFNLNSDQDLRLFQKNYGLAKKSVDKIKKLKKFEFMAATKEHFNLYDPQNDFNVEQTKMVTGILIPPASHHLPPSGHKSMAILTEDSIRVFNYATQLLKKNGLVLYNYEEGKKIYTPVDRILNNRTKYKRYYVNKIKTPKIIEGMDFGKLFYKKSQKKRLISYDEVMDYGLMIWRVGSKKNMKFLLSKLSPSSGAIPYPDKPTPVKGFFFNPTKRTLRLYGDNCSSKEVSV
jgi:hypothetical protein